MASRSEANGGVAQGTRSRAVTYCDACGKPADEGDHSRCADRRAHTDPPRFCTQCGRKLAVQVLPTGYTARCVRCG
jgi:hypothetical protein